MVFNQLATYEGSITPTCIITLSVGSDVEEALLAWLALKKQKGRVISNSAMVSPKFCQLVAFCLLGQLLRTHGPEGRSVFRQPHFVFIIVALFNF